MCGRYFFNYTSSSKSKEIKDRVEKLNLDSFKVDEIFPGDNVLCIIPKENKIDLCVKKWGIKTSGLLINARKETINSKVTFKNLKRCVVIANGFYEWKDKKKYYIKTEEEFIYLACIYDEEDDLVIITKQADDDFKSIHNRMPIIMNQNEMLDYLHLNKYPNNIKRIKYEEIKFANIK